MSDTMRIVYLPDLRWKRRELRNLINQLPAHALILGNFNSHNTMLGIWAHWRQKRNRFDIRTDMGRFSSTAICFNRTPLQKRIPPIRYSIEKADWRVFLPLSKFRNCEETWMYKHVQNGLYAACRSIPKIRGKSIRKRVSWWRENYYKAN